MRNIMFVIVGIWVFSALSLCAQESPVVPDLTIEDVISNQLSAFNDRDVEEAWAYASPFIKGIFGNPGNFGTMVQRGYPMVWDNDAVRFLELRDVNGRPMQKVMLRDADGGVHFLEYEMLETPDGWQINGVALVEPDLSA
ncbi:DUF4864 domain-containing protein [Yoonia sp. 208BN28-4]|uniref:DUF4864 domain-containing protein n=1 Tax=Yoonia sp. 208BN28-4 TaxID=3126505 RepID=UPI0030AD0459